MLKQIRVGGQVIAIQRQSDSLTGEDGHKQAGTFDVRMSLIRICTEGYSETEQLNTFVHEVGHAITDAACVEFSEEQNITWANGWHCVLRDSQLAQLVYRRREVYPYKIRIGARNFLIKAVDKPLFTDNQQRYTSDFNGEIGEIQIAKPDTSPTYRLSCVVHRINYAVIIDRAIDIEQEDITRLSRGWFQVLSDNDLSFLHKEVK